MTATAEQYSSAHSERSPIKFASPYSDWIGLRANGSFLPYCLDIQGELDYGLDHEADEPKAQ